MRDVSRYRPAAIVLGLLVVLAGCAASTAGTGNGSSTSSPGTTPGTPTTATASPAGGGAARVDPAGTVWLCRPGLAGNPCTPNLDANVVSPTGARTVQDSRAATGAKFDCFYVYPTVSGEKTPNADLVVEPAEVGVAVEQAARFSQVCNLWAPMYRQVTVAALFTGGQAAIDVAYASVLSAWKDYIAHFNDGRPIVFIGHSQGAAMLIRLLRSEVDPNPAIRKLLVSAIILGGNVVVPTGASVGGSFRHIPVCASATDTGCVIAYSSFLLPPPPGALFGRPGLGVSIQSGQTATTGLQVVCTNPAALAGGTGPLRPYLAVATSAGGAPAVTWSTYPSLYTAHCARSGGATWLQVTDVGGAADHRARLTQTLGPAWGLHLYDVNIALGNLVSDVAAEEGAYR